VELERLERVDLLALMKVKEDKGDEKQMQLRAVPRAPLSSTYAEAGASGWASPPPSDTFHQPLQAAAARAIRTPWKGVLTNRARAAHQPLPVSSSRYDRCRRGVICNYIIVPEQAQIGEARAVVGAGEGRKPLQAVLLSLISFQLARREALHYRHFP
jgi:hypothetical protein